LVEGLGAVSECDRLGDGVNQNRVHAQFQLRFCPGDVRPAPARVCSLC
jgi:hypothetical protein